MDPKITGSCSCNSKVNFWLLPYSWHPRAILVLLESRARVRFFFGARACVLDSFFGARGALVRLCMMRYGETTLLHGSRDAMPNNKRTYSITTHEIVAKRSDNYVTRASTGETVTRQGYTADMHDDLKISYALPQSQKYLELRDVLSREVHQPPETRPAWSIITCISGLCAKEMIVYELGDRNAEFISRSVATNNHDPPARCTRHRTRARARVTVRDVDNTDDEYTPSESSDDDEEEDAPTPKRARGAAATAPKRACDDDEEEDAPVPKRARGAAAAAPCVVARDVATNTIAGIVYTVLLKSVNKRYYYTGATEWNDRRLLAARLDSHISDRLSSSSRLWPDTEHFSITVTDFFSVQKEPGEDPCVTLASAENKRTVALMNEHGFASVRGGVFCSTPFGRSLLPEQAAMAQSMLNLRYGSTEPFGRQRH